MDFDLASILKNEQGKTWIPNPMVLPVAALGAANPVPKATGLIPSPEDLPSLNYEDMAPVVPEAAKVAIPGMATFSVLKNLLSGPDAQTQAAEQPMTQPPAQPAEAPGMAAADVRQHMTQPPAQPAEAPGMAAADVRQHMMKRLGQPSPAEAAYNRLLQAQSRALEEQRRGVKRTEDLAKMYGKLDAPSDLSGVLSGLSFFAGEDLTKGYKAPDDPRDKAIQLEQLAQKQREKVAQNEINLLRSQAKAQMGGGGLTAAQEAMDKQFGKDYAKFIGKGGFADAEKGLSQLREAMARLDQNPNIVGGISAYLPGQSVTNPELAAVRESVEEVVQRNLRAVLGAQFTEKEGERLISRAFNPKLGAKENLNRLGRLARQMRTAIDNKKAAYEHFKNRGTMKGYTGPDPNKYTKASDFVLDEQKAAPKEGDTKEWDGVTYKAIGGNWVPQ